MFYFFYSWGRTYPLPSDQFASSTRTLFLNQFLTPWKHQKTLGSTIPQSNSSPSRKEPLKCWSSDIVIKFFWNNSYISKSSIAKNFIMFFISHPNYKSQGQSLVYLPQNRIIWFKIRDHPFSTCEKFSEKLTFLPPPPPPPDTLRTCAYQGWKEVRNVSFSENFAYVVNGWPLRMINIILEIISITMAQYIWFVRLIESNLMEMQKCFKPIKLR